MIQITVYTAVQIVSTPYAVISIQSQQYLAQKEVRGCMGNISAIPLVPFYTAYSISLKLLTLM
ncbi:hypothetical protein HZS_939 [Henneguya salminicola]|nr:hypothetical protein HZS_939 [Henneguya salminicola]